MDFLLVQFLTGLSNAASLFLVASGLSIIFGVTRILNFAHGSLYMLGAYMALSLAGVAGDGVAGYWGSLLAVAVAVGLAGVVMEVLVLRRIYRSPELFQLVATFGVVLIVRDLVLLAWGPDEKLGPRAPGLDGALRIGEYFLPEYDLVLIVLGPLVLGLLWLLFHRTRWGTLVRAATEDRQMLAALGVNQGWIFTGVFFLGAFLAGLGGALQLPREPVSLMMDLNIIAEAFVVVVVGGMGSITGAFLAAVIIGELNAFGILILPRITIVLMFLVMMLVLIVRPTGLLGSAESASEGEQDAAPSLRLPGLHNHVALGAAAALLVALPLAAGDFTVVLTTDILIFALFAGSLHLIMGAGGMVSFGHAAYFGLGAYAASLGVVYGDTPMSLALVLAPAAAAIGGLVFGWFCVRLSDVYLAMLSLAFAQITWSVAVQWYEVTGGDDGLLGIWPSQWASGRVAYYYVVLAVTGAAILLIRRLHFVPFGYVLRAGRDSPLRAAAIGIDVQRQRWFAFALAGMFAGLAGGLYAFAKGSIFPDELAIPRSIDALVMVLLGGVHTLSGPLVGAAAFVGLEDQLSSLTYWRLILGLIIVGICVAMPAGIVGSLQEWLGRRDGGEDDDGPA